MSHHRRNKPLTNQTQPVRPALSARNVLPSDTLLVGFDFSHGEDFPILIVGHKEGKFLQIINAFQGEDAREIYKLLTTVKQTEEKKEDHLE